MKSSLSVIGLLLVQPQFVAGQEQKICISEFMARNEFTLVDEDGDDPDWIELHNFGEKEVKLKGWNLTDDDQHNIDRLWSIPDISLEPGEYVVIWLSGKDRSDLGSEFHARFRLRGDGEYVALIYRDGKTVIDQKSFNTQSRDVSMGRAADTGDWVFFDDPTPGEPNNDKGRIPDQDE